MGTQLIRATKGRLTVGRAPDNDYVIDHPMVSGHHARLTSKDGGWLLEDLGAANGTFLNGERVTAPVAIGGDDRVQIGPVRLRFAADGQVESDDLRLATRVDVQGVTFDVKPGVRLLRDVSFTIEPGEFVALMGPAGAGKTTLMENMNGNMHPTEGRVLVNGIDLHAQFDAMRGHIGYVPQDDIVHRNLTVYEACYYTAKLRMKGLTEKELHDRVVEVLVELDIAHRANTVIGGPEARVLSGGQRKRVNLAMELVTDPAILFLDEPTSGLSSADAKSVMDVLKGLSKKGRTIILTIHQPAKEIYEMMDNALILGVGGRLIYYGSTLDSYARFGSGPTPDLLFEKLSPKGMVEGDWDAMQRAYTETHWYKRFVVDRADAGRTQHMQAPVARAGRSFGFRQFFILFERLTKLYTRDVGWLIGAVVGAPVLMFFLAMLLDKPDQRHVLLFISTLLAFFFGIFPAIEMMHSERTIYMRERMVNLKIPSYLMSKIVFLLAFGMFQAASLTAVLYWYSEVDASFPPLFLILLSVQVAGVTSGLFFSTLAKSSKLALLLMLAWLVLMLAFSGFVIRLPTLRDQGTGMLLAPSAMRWGLGGLMDAVNDVATDKVLFFGFEDDLWSLNAVVNGFLALLPAFLTAIVLKMRDRV
ncbi:MAG: ATP-binding cassette domain-containing protein [Proteobacteria bacterium]|jgi:ABC-type multidrug transport system ATPase subunit|nr:ATP-binding cassette domain-containing protein [Pseudomonadota bacterium]